MNAKEVAAFAKTIHANIAADLCPDGAGELRCGKCGRVQSMTQQHVARYLRSGWPKCHGQTMTWVTARQLAAESAEQG